MDISKPLQTLIDAALEDGKLSDKEKLVLLNRAEKEGLDVDEFEIYIESICHKRSKQQKDDSESFFMKTIYFRPEGYVKEEIVPGALDTLTGALSGGVRKEYQDVYKKELRIRVWHLVSVLTIISVVSIMIISFLDKPSYEDYLTNYDFENARIAAAKLNCREEGNSWDGKFSCPRTEALLKIIIAESQFWTDNLEFERAISVVKEINGLEKYNELLSRGVINRSQNEFIDELVYSIIVEAINHPDRVTPSKIKSYVGLIKNDNQARRLVQIIGAN